MFYIMEKKKNSVKPDHDVKDFLFIVYNCIACLLHTGNDKAKNAVYKINGKYMMGNTNSIQFHNYENLKKAVSFLLILSNV